MSKVERVPVKRDMSATVESAVAGGSVEESSCSSEDWTQWEFVDVGASTGKVPTPKFGAVHLDEADSGLSHSGAIFREDSGSLVCVDMFDRQVPEHLDEEKQAVENLHEEYLRQQRRLELERSKLGHAWHLYESRYVARDKGSAMDSVAAVGIDDLLLSSESEDCDEMVVSDLTAEKRKAKSELEAMKTEYRELVAMADTLKRQLSSAKEKQKQVKASGSVERGGSSLATDWRCAKCKRGYPTEFLVCPICEVPKGGSAAVATRTAASGRTPREWHELLSFSSFLGGGALTMRPCETRECGWVLSKRSGVDVRLDLSVRLEKLGSGSGVEIAEENQVTSYSLSESEKDLYVMAHVSAPAIAGKYSATWQLTLASDISQRVGPVLNLNVVVRSEFKANKERKIAQLMEVYSLKASDRHRVVEALTRSKWDMTQAAERIARSLS